MLTIELAPYEPALWVLTGLALVVLIQALLTAPLAFANGQQTPGQSLQGDHELLSFRVIRTHLNSVESLAPFGFGLLMAIFCGVGEGLVNGCAIAHLVFRLAFWVVYYAGTGAVAGGPRTLSFVGGLLSNIVLIVATFVTLVR